MKILASLPAWVVRLFMKPEKLRYSLKIDLRGNAPGQVSDSSAVPRLDMWLRITNHSAFPVIMDRLDIEVWFGQPFARAAMIQRKEVAAHSEVEDLHVVIFLSGTQVEHIRKGMQSQVWKPEITLQAIGFFTSKLGWTEVNATILRQDFPVSIGTSGR